MADNPMYKAIMEWSLKHHDGTSESDVSELDPEKRAFLDNAIKNFMENETKTMLGLVEGIQAPEGSQEEIDAKLDCLEELIDVVDRIDYAIGFHTFGKGFHPAIDLTVTSRSAAVRAKAAELVATCVQNNPACQAWAFEHRALQKLFVMHRGELSDGSQVREEGPTEGERTKALSALSGLIQNTPEAAGEQAFLQEGGLNLLKDDLRPAIGVRLKVKALFFLQWLLRGNELARKHAFSLELSADLAACAAEEDDEVAQNAWLGLSEMVKENREAVLAQLSAKQPGLSASVVKRIEGFDKETLDEETLALANKLAQDLGTQA